MSTWANQTKNSSIFTNQSKNSGSWTLTSKNTASWSNGTKQSATYNNLSKSYTLLGDWTEDELIALIGSSPDFTTVIPGTGLAFGDTTFETHMTALRWTNQPKN